MHVIATAGHVDHGKSRLVEALTGMDPDRLEEEKRRGLTIDLGFAWLKLPSGQEVGIVDVPGHERFIKNMLAGVGAISVTLFIVAANEGWKPQSQEHLDILDLLGVTSGIAVITKSDLVDAARLKEVVEDVSEKLQSTSLRRSQIIPVSAVTGAGIEELLVAIEELLERAAPAEDQGRPRLWVDRIFSMRGSGTVVTGTLNDGGFAQQDDVVVLPSGVRARVRSIQSHKKRVDKIGPGNRTALNLVGADLAEILRGDVVTLSDRWMTTSKLLVDLRFLTHLTHSPSERGAFKFYIGSAERDAVIRFLRKRPDNSEPTPTVVQLDRPVVVDWGDRFVLRDSGRRETLGGGTVLEPHAARFTKPSADHADRRREIYERRNYAQLLIDEEGIISKKDLNLRVGPEVSHDEPDAVVARTFIFSNERFASLENRLRSLLEEHHRDHPLDPGLERETARAAMGIDAATFEELTSVLQSRGGVVGDETALRLSTHSVAPPEPESAAVIHELEGKASPPTVPELEKRFDPALIRALVRSGTLVRVSKDLVYPTEWIEDLKRTLRKMLEESEAFTVAEFRDAIGTTRKYAVPLLEYLDQIGFTRRRGDERVPGPNF
jgi:selenocysteine-specific elongation factor